MARKGKARGPQAVSGTVVPSGRCGFVQLHEIPLRRCVHCDCTNAGQERPKSCASCGKPLALLASEPPKPKKKKRRIRGWDLSVD